MKHQPLDVSHLLTPTDWASIVLKAAIPLTLIVLAIAAGAGWISP